MNRHPLNPPATIETERLRLRPPTMEDAPSIYERYASDPEVTRLLSWRPHESVEQTRTFLRLLLEAREAGTVHAWIVEGRADRRLMGLLSMTIQTVRKDDFLSTEEERRYYEVSFGYHLSRSEWGRGFATEAARTIVQWALDQPEVYRIWSVCDIENHASARVLEKAGLVREGTLKRWSIHPNVSAEPRDFHCYALVK
ncbi:MAG: GNAT family N-acetyltransferase [Chloroflexi bacterium]|nr:GNAT family N-acetyltransferase [Chloroflexota bacterium]